MMMVVVGVELLEVVVIGVVLVGGIVVLWGLVWKWLVVMLVVGGGVGKLGLEGVVGLGVVEFLLIGLVVDLVGVILIVHNQFG